jgi:hypothetical protein
VSALFRRFRFVAAIVVGAAAAMGADLWLGLGRGAALAAIVAVAVVYMIIEWRYDVAPDRRRSRESRTPYRSPFEVSFDDEEIIVTLDGARRESVRWKDLITVGIRIDQEGFLPATYWVLGGAPGGCYFPTDAEGNQALLEALQTRLPNFDNRALIEAMGLMEGGRVLWQRPAAASS